MQQPKQKKYVVADYECEARKQQNKERSHQQKDEDSWLNFDCRTYANIPV